MDLKCFKWIQNAIWTNTLIKEIPFQIAPTERAVGGVSYKAARLSWSKKIIYYESIFEPSRLVWKTMEAEQMLVLCWFECRWGSERYTEKYECARAFYW